MSDDGKDKFRQCAESHMHGASSLNVGDRQLLVFSADWERLVAERDQALATLAEIPPGPYVNVRDHAEVCAQRDRARELLESARAISDQRAGKIQELEREREHAIETGCFGPACTNLERAEKAEAACAQMRATLTDISNGYLAAPALASEALNATDAGKDWVSPEQAAAMRGELQEVRDFLDDLLGLSLVPHDVKERATALLMSKALTSNDAGKALLERVERYERALTDAERWLKPHDQADDVAAALRTIRAALAEEKE